MSIRKNYRGLFLSLSAPPRDKNKALPALVVLTITLASMVVTIPQPVQATDLVLPDICDATGGCWAGPGSLGCNFLVGTPLDTDGDGDPNSSDPDDDCDQLADDLEIHYELDPLSGTSFDQQDDRFNMVLEDLTSTTIPMKVKFNQLSHSAYHPDAVNWPEPFVPVGMPGEPTETSNAGLSLALTGDGQPEHLLPKIPGLNCDVHPKNTQSVTIEEEVTLPTGSWPRSFKDVTYANRVNVADIPKIGLQLPLWDDDDTHETQCDSGSEPYVSSGTNRWWAAWQLTQLANIDVLSEDQVDTTISLGSATISLRIPTSFNTCAIWWANALYAKTGEQVPVMISLSDLPSGGTGPCY